MAAGHTAAGAPQPAFNGAWANFALGAGRSAGSAAAAAGAHAAHPGRGLQAQPDPAQRGRSFPLGLVSSARDPAEVEADRSAELVVQAAPAPAAPAGAAGSGQMSAAPRAGSSAAPAGGQPLDRGTQRQMEQHFKVDFGAVRVHTGAAAAQAAGAVQARAFASGSDIVFNHGEYSPATPRGRKLLAHELTHVVQQGAAPARGSPAITARAPAAGRAGIQRSPQTRQLIDDEFDVWRDESTQARADGDGVAAAWAMRMVLMLQGVDADEFEDADDVNDFLADLYHDADDELATLARTGAVAERITEAFPQLWSGRVFDALTLPADMAALAAQADEQLQLTQQVADRVPAEVGASGLPVTLSEAAGLVEFHLELKHLALDREHVVKDLALQARTYAAVGWVQGFYTLWNAMANDYAEQVADGEIVVNFDDYTDFVETRRAGLDALADRIASVTTEEMMQAVDDDTRAITRLAFVQSFVSVLGGLVPAMMYWAQAAQMFDAKLAELDATIAGEDSDDKILRALDWAWENEYFSAAAWQIVQGLWAEKWKILGITAFLIGVQFIPGLDVLVDLALIAYAGIDAVQALADLVTVFQAVAASTSAVSLQRNSARMAGAMEGDSLRVILDLLAIKGAAKGIRSRADALKASAGLSEEEALKQALRESSGKEAGAIKNALARQRIGKGLDPQGLLNKWFDAGLDAELAEQALISGLKPARIARIAEQTGDLARAQQIIEYAGHNSAPINALLDTGLSVERVGQMMDANAGLREIGAVQRVLGNGGMARAGELIDAYAALGDASPLGRLTQRGIVSVFEAGGQGSLKLVMDTIGLEGTGRLTGFDAWVQFTITASNKTGGDLLNTLGELREAQRLIGELGPGERVRIGNDLQNGKSFDMVVEDASGQSVRNVDVTSVAGRVKNATDLTAGIKHGIGKLPSIKSGTAEVTIQADLPPKQSIGAGRSKLFEPNGDWKIQERDGSVHTSGNLLDEMVGNTPSIKGADQLSAIHVVRPDGSRIGSLVNLGGQWTRVP